MMIYQIYANVMVMIFFSRPRDGDDDISNIRNCGGDDDVSNIRNYGGDDDVSNICNCGGDQGCISCGTCSYLELTEDHVLTSAYVKIFRIVTRNAVNKSF